MEYSSGLPFDEKNPARHSVAYLPAGAGCYRKHFNLRQATRGGVCSSTLTA
jgi:hypothetical protein